MLRLFKVNFKEEKRRERTIMSKNTNPDISYKISKTKWKSIEKIEQANLNKWQKEQNIIIIIIINY